MGTLTQVKMIQNIDIDTSFKHPFTCIVAGPTKSGKTVLVSRLVKQAKELISPPPEKIIWCYTEYQPIYSKLEGVTLHEGPPPVDQLKATSAVPKLLILDDLMTELKRDKSLVELFVKGILVLCLWLFFGAKTAVVCCRVPPLERQCHSHRAERLFW